MARGRLGGGGTEPGGAARVRHHARCQCFAHCALLPQVSLHVSNIGLGLEPSRHFEHKTYCGGITPIAGPHPINPWPLQACLWAGTGIQASGPVLAPLLQASLL